MCNFLSSVDLRLCMARCGFRIRELTFRELWNLRKYQCNKRYDEHFLKITEENVKFIYPDHEMIVYQLKDFSIF